MRDGAAASGWRRLSALAGVLVPLLSPLPLPPPPQPESHETTGAPSRASDTRLEYWF